MLKLYPKLNRSARDCRQFLNTRNQSYRERGTKENPRAAALQLMSQRSNLINRPIPVKALTWRSDSALPKKALGISLARAGTLSLFG